MKNKENSCSQKRTQINPNLSTKSNGERLKSSNILLTKNGSLNF